MDNLGKFIYMAGFAMLFVFASSISIYLYGTLYAYLQTGTESANIVYRAEGTSSSLDLSNFKREITNSEVLITLYNMRQMHVSQLTYKKAGENFVVSADTLPSDKDFKAVVRELKEPHRYSYSFKLVDEDGLIEVTYVEL